MAATTDGGRSWGLPACANPHSRSSVGEARSRNGSPRQRGLTAGVRSETQSGASCSQQDESAAKPAPIENSSLPVADSCPTSLDEPARGLTWDISAILIMALSPPAG